MDHETANIPSERSAFTRVTNCKSSTGSKPASPAMEAFEAERSFTKTVFNEPFWSRQQKQAKHVFKPIDTNAEMGKLKCKRKWLFQNSQFLNFFSLKNVIYCQLLDSNFNKWIPFLFQSINPRILLRIKIIEK